MSNYVKIERIPYEEPYHIQLVWNISNGNTSSCFEFYDNADSLIKIAERLECFPRHSSDVFLYEIGSEKSEDRFAYYFRFRVFTTDSRGSSAIQIRFCNNNELPHREIVELCIQTEPAAINRLGKLFREFSKLDTEYMAWSEIESFIGSKSEYA
ncbi:hypothetical protein [Shewanella japonica]|uniref:DUF4265 domain-containing protein n=1 Tax=Shewanella japonica TaxID=93973 RepID=A0ABN4YEJ4_9GAMM|nr:hypothetical protein [Shewanella japonica]ARD21189.1 hypothetical protein SJ2017_0858 [Shewanella japonica]